MTRDSYLRRSVGTLSRRIKESRVLLVGAGGIGCELLKNLLLTGFGEIHIIDLDTIDLSNLNRQFLFRYEHIKKSKALVAKEVAHKFQPRAKLEAYHANIKDSQFNVDWFSGFDVVFNALDNLDARRYVNRMCLAADVPLIESGTTGFNGQVQVIKKSATTVTQRKSRSRFLSAPFAVLRVNQFIASSGPKAISFRTCEGILSQEAGANNNSELFGQSEDAAEELDHSADAENAEEIANLRKEAQALKEIRQSMTSAEFPRKVFEKVFKTDIDRLRGMEDMWKTRKPPESLDFDKLEQESSPIEATVSSNDQKVWTTAEDFVVFKDSLNRLSMRMKELQDSAMSETHPVLDFDKDDVDTLDFVTAAANLRATIFAIDPKSKFDTKQMAGNIIPAIATTNAMTAGLCVLQAMKVLKEDFENAKMVFLERSGARAINSDSLKPPNPNCPVCSVATGRITIDPERATINDLVENVLRSQLGYGEEFMINTELGTIYDPDLEDNLPKKLVDVGLNNESFLTVVDDSDEPRVNLQLIIRTAEPSSTAEDQKPITLEKAIDIPRKPKAPTPPPESGLEPGDQSATGKRKREAYEADLENGDVNAKRVHSEAANGDDKAEPIVLDEAEGGAILIDDD